MTLLLGFIALFVGWLAPGHFLPWINFQNEVSAAAGGLLLGVSACVVAKREQGIRWPAPAAVALALTLVAAAQLATGQIRYLSDGVLAVVYLAAFAAAIVAGATLTRSSERQQFVAGLFAVLLAAGIASTGLAATQWLELGPIGFVEMIRPGDRPGANLVQANHLSTLLCLALMSALWFFETRRINGATLAIAASWLAIGLVMTRSRTSWVFLILLCVLWVSMRSRVESRLSPRALAAAIGLFILGVLVWGPLSQTLAVHVPVSVADRIQGGTARLGMWKAILAGLLESPWVGYGWTQVSRAALEGSIAQYTGEHMLRNSHSLLLDLLVWNGIPLGALIIGLIGWWLVRAVRACRDAGYLVALLALCAILTHALFEYPLEYMYFLIPAGLLVGHLDTLASMKKQTWRAPTFTLALPVAALTAMMLWISVEYLRVHQASDDGLMLAAGYARKAELPDVVLLDGPREYIRFWRTQAGPNMTDEQLQWMRNVVGRNPSPPALLRLAMATGLNGRPEEARETLVRLCNMHVAPRCEEGRRSWSAVQEHTAALRAIPFPATPAVTRHLTPAPPAATSRTGPVGPWAAGAASAPIAQ